MLDHAVGRELASLLACFEKGTLCLVAALEAIADDENSALFTSIVGALDRREQWLTHFHRLLALLCGDAPPL